MWIWLAKLLNIVMKQLQMNALVLMITSKLCRVLLNLGQLAPPPSLGWWLSSYTISNASPCYTTENLITNNLAECPAAKKGYNIAGIATNISSAANCNALFVQPIEGNRTAKFFLPLSSSRGNNSSEIHYPVNIIPPTNNLFADEYIPSKSTLLVVPDSLKCSLTERIFIPPIISP